MHKIRRQIIEIDLPQERGAIELQRQVSRLMQEEVLPALSAQFDRLDLGDAILRIPKLDIDLGILATSNWKQTFVAATIQSISKEVSALASAGQSQNHAVKPVHDRPLQVRDDQPINSSPASESGLSDLDTALPILVRSDENLLDIYLYFLKNGRLPWHAKGLKMKEIEEGVFEESHFGASSVEGVIKQHPNALQRLVWQGSPRLKRVFMELILGFTPQHIQAVEQLIERALLTSDELVIWQCAIKKDTKIPVVTPAEIVDWLQENPLIEATRGNVAEKIDTPFLTVYQAGLVVLSPYIPMFFEALNLIEDNAFKSEENQQKAIHLLWYLGGGAPIDSEVDLVLHKLLCGYELEASLPIVELTDADLSECEALLEAVIRNWPALKNTSADGLRSAFFATGRAVICAQ